MSEIAEEEQGINILYVAIGFLQWFEDERSDVKREAPLILVPVTLVRDRRRSTFDLKFREDDTATNQAIQERLKTTSASPCRKSRKTKAGGQAIISHAQVPGGADYLIMFGSRSDTISQ
jgi:hypothetical protein